MNAPPLKQLVLPVPPKGEMHHCSDRSQPLNFSCQNLVDSLPIDG
jgi:hypothetical protein